MSWGDVWVCDHKVRPTIEGAVPQSPWILAGVISREERAFIEAVERLQATRGSHARKVDFYLQVHTPAVALARTGAKAVEATFEPDGLWVAVDLTPADGSAGSRFVVFTQRVHAASLARRTPDKHPGATRRPLAVLPLRGRARSGASALEWGYRAPRD